MACQTPLPVIRGSKIQNKENQFKMRKKFYKDLAYAALAVLVMVAGSIAAYYFLTILLMLFMFGRMY